MNRGLFITFEGGDGSGKSTQIDLLMAYIDKFWEGTVLLTREPGGTQISEKIREILIDKDNKEMTDRAEALGYAMSRAQHVEEFIEPNLAKGNSVICSRFTDSSVVYQGHARGLGVEEVEAINAFATNGLQPDITILLDIPAKVGLARKKNQQEMDRLELAGLDFHEKVNEGYRYLAARYVGRTRVIDATLSINEINNQVLAYVDEIYNKRSSDKYTENHLAIIETLSHEDMAFKFRHGKSGHPYFVKGSKLNEAFMKRFESFGGMTPEVSKMIGRKW